MIMNDLKFKGVYETFDYAQFLKNNEEFEKSIKYYTDILNIIDKNHPILIENFNKEKEVNLTSFYTFKNPDLFRLPVKTKFYYSQSVDMIIFGESFKADIYKEEALDNLIDWKFTNYFWIHQGTEKVVKSNQSITPKNPKVFYTVTREYIK